MRTTVILAVAASCLGTVWLGCGSEGDDDSDVTDTVQTEDATGADADGDADGDADVDGAVDADADADGNEDAPGDTADAPVANAPICEGGTGSGTRRRWVDPVSGFEYCEAPCRDCTAVCLNGGTRSEGWYAACSDPGTEAGCGTAPGLIGWADCI